jgi:predicted ATP-dependent endonuclease of OLD family
MHISKIKIKNFKCFDDVEINFDPNFNLIIGENNSGKSTIFEALRLWQIAIQQFFSKRTGKKGDGSNNISFYRKYQFEPLEINDLSFLRIDNFTNILNNKINFKEQDYIENSIKNTFLIELTFSSTGGNSATIPIIFRPNDKNILRCRIGLNEKLTFDDLKSYSHSLSKVMDLVNNDSFINRIRLAYIPPKFTLPNKEVLLSENNSYILEKLIKGESQNVIRNILHHWCEFSYQTKTKEKKAELIEKSKERLINIIEPEKLKENFDNIKPFIENVLDFEVKQRRNIKSKFLKSIENGLYKIVNQNFDFISENNPIDDYVLQIKERGNNTEVSQLGSGTINVLNILSVLSYNDQTIENATKCNLLLLDEPDSHLQFNLQNKLFDYLNNQSKDEKKQIFIITHNSSLISQFDKVLFIKNGEKTITPISLTDYLENHLKNIDENHYNVMLELHNAKKVKDSVEKQLNEITKPILFCEGTTDVTILKKAYSKLFPKTDFFENLIDINGGGGASKVCNHLLYNSNSEICIIGLFDRDKEGKEHFDRLQKDGKGFCLVNSSNFHCLKTDTKTHALTLPVPSERNQYWFNENLFIEYMFSDEILQNCGVELEQLDYMNIKTIKSKIGKDLKKDSDIEKNKILKKIDTFSKEDFKHFIPLFQKIAEIINFELPKVDINA